MSWIRESISDENGMADMAYVAIGWLVAIMVGSIVFLCAMSAIAYFRCDQITDVGQGVRAAIACPYDPNPLGIAIAACLGAFGSPIGALALYMGQNKRSGATSKTTTTKTETVAVAAPAPDATVAAPLPVQIIAKQPVPTRETPLRRQPINKRKQKGGR